MKFLSKTHLLSFFLVLPLLFIVSCDKDDDEKGRTEIIISPSATAADEAQLAFIEADDKTTIIFEAGTFDFTSTLSIDGKDDIIIKGAGKDETFLDFSGQATGGEGVLASNCTNIRFQDLTIMDSEGDALKARDCDYVSFVNIGTVWSGVPDENNGAYGLYPVLCTYVYIDNCYAYGASDAGIYVGQSDKVILKNSVAEANVAGIEIENTTNADVFDNEAFDNTGGILIFDLPGLTKYGSNVRVFNNDIHDNNRTNFAPDGNIVGNVGAGTGFMILSTKNVEFFSNVVQDNNFASVLIASYLIYDDSPNDPDYAPFPSGVYIHENTLNKGAAASNPIQPDLIGQMIDQLLNLGYELPEIVSDGIFLGATSFCIQESSNPSFLNLNALVDDTLGSVLNDITLHDCTKPNLPEVVFTPY